MKRLIIIFVSIAALCSCSKFPLQKPVKYDPQPLDPHQGVSCWEFICSNSSFATMKQAVQMCSMEEYYSSPKGGYTYLLLNETAFNSYILPQFGAGDIEEVPVDKMKDILLFHIIKGEYSSYNGTLSYDPVHVITLWENVDAVMTIKLNDDGSLSQKQQDKMCFMDQCGRSTMIKAFASDYLMTNGPAHILSRHCVYVR